MVKPLLEAELQTWFEEEALQNNICSYIVNASILEQVPNASRLKIRKSVRNRLEALDRARRVYDSLLEAHLISGNKSVSPAGSNQLRPDLVLVSDSGNYLLVELKTNKASERQAVQELLAYSSIIKMQLPFLSDFMFIIVSMHWDALLSYSVKSLILDRKFVLPLKFIVDDDGEFKLSIQSHLFDEEKITEFYDPYFAMIPSTMAVFLQKNKRDYSSSSRLYENDLFIIEQFRKAAFSILNECQRINQSGFVLVWENETQSDGKVISLTTVTVDQFWKYSDANNSGFYPEINMNVPGIERLAMSSVLINSIESIAKYNAHGCNDNDGVFLNDEFSQLVSKKFSQSSLSFDLINRHFLPEQKDLLYRQFNICNFDVGGFNNLGDLLNSMNDIKNENGLITMRYFLTFGDISDYLLECENFTNYYGYNLKLLNQCMDGFRKWKKK